MEDQEEEEEEEEKQEDAEVVPPKEAEPFPPLPPAMMALTAPETGKKEEEKDGEENGGEGQAPADNAKVDPAASKDPLPDKATNDDKEDKDQWWQKRGWQGGWAHDDWRHKQQQPWMRNFPPEHPIHRRRHDLGWCRICYVKTRKAGLSVTALPALCLSVALVAARMTGAA